METRTFQAREIKEALALVRRELGPEAVIMETRRVSGRALGLLGGSFVEVTAAPAPNAPTAPKRSAPAAPRRKTRSAVPPPAPATDSQPRLLAEQRARRTRRAPKKPVSSLIAENPAAAIAAANPPAGVVPHAALRRRLLASMVPRDLCEAWIRQLPDVGVRTRERAESEAALRSLLHRVLGPPAPLCQPGSRIAALVGPTGVGKTTTAAKLAARAKLLEGKHVALISLDDQRIGGTTQLRAFAKLLDVPMTTAAAAGGLAHAVAAFSDAELIIIDTAGISPARPDLFGPLGKKLGRAGEPVTVHLAVAAATRIEELDRILHLYRATHPTALLPTKVDEAVAIGSVLAARTRLGCPLSFAAVGQQIPDDLVSATPNFIIDLLLGGSNA